MTIRGPVAGRTLIVPNAEGFFNTWYEKPAMLRLLGDVTGHRILDAGCGSGPTSVALTERGADVSGFDLSAAMIEIARRRLTGTDQQVHDLVEPLPWKDATWSAWPCSAGDRALG